MEKHEEGVIDRIFHGELALLKDHRDALKWVQSNEHLSLTVTEAEKFLPKACVLNISFSISMLLSS